MDHQRAIIWCSPSAALVPAGAAGVIVLPEDIDQREIDFATERFPEAIVVAAVRHGRQMLGVIYHRGQRRAHYLKVGGDGHSEGERRPEHFPIYQVGGLAVGLLVCMDIYTPDYRLDVFGQLHSSDAAHRVLCVPAQMAGHWFTSATIDYPCMKGIQLAVSNGSRHPSNNRLRSFITDHGGTKVAEQSEDGPINHALTLLREPGA